MINTPDYSVFGVIERVRFVTRRNGGIGRRRRKFCLGKRRVGLGRRRRVVLFERKVGICTWKVAGGVSAVIGLVRNWGIGGRKVRRLGGRGRGKLGECRS
jgi:hypothetical protein